MPHQDDLGEHGSMLIGCPSTSRQHVGRRHCPGGLGLRRRPCFGTHTQPPAGGVVVGSSCMSVRHRHRYIHLVSSRERSLAPPTVLGFAAKIQVRCRSFFARRPAYIRCTPPHVKNTSIPEVYSTMQVSMLRSRVPGQCRAGPCALGGIHRLPAIQRQRLVPIAPHVAAVPQVWPA